MKAGALAAVARGWLTRMPAMELIDYLCWFYMSVCGVSCTGTESNARTLIRLQCGRSL